MTDDETKTIEVPRDAFVRHVLGMAIEFEDFRRKSSQSESSTKIHEGDSEWQCSDEVADQIGYDDLQDVSNVTYIEQDGRRVTVGLDLDATVSELVTPARRNPPGKAHPAEYRHHDVAVHATAELWFPKETECLPETHLFVEQAQYPTEPPAPDVDAHRYDEL